jgi:hypothetical protein
MSGCWVCIRGWVYITRRMFFHGSVARANYLVIGYGAHGAWGMGIVSFEC